MVASNPIDAHASSSSDQRVPLNENGQPAGPDSSTDTNAAASQTPEGISATNALGDLVWEDTNRNGAQDPGEPGAEGFRVDLLDASGQPVDGDGDGQPDTTTTDANGNYLFEGLADGTYRVRFAVPDGRVFTTQNAGDDAADSDANADGVTGTVTLGPDNGDDRSVDAGLLPITDPSPTDPSPTVSQPTEPSPTDPSPTVSQPTEPSPTEPSPTDPSPTVSQPTNLGPQPTDPQPTVTGPPVQTDRLTQREDSNGDVVAIGLSVLSGLAGLGAFTRRRMTD